MTDPDERFKIEGDPEDALRELLKVDADSEPVTDDEPMQTEAPDKDTDKPTK